MTAIKAVALITYAVILLLFALSVSAGELATPEAAPEPLRFLPYGAPDATEPGAAR